MNSEDEAGVRNPGRRFERLVEEQEIFHNSGYSWGNRDRLYQAVQGSVRVSRYLPDWGRKGPDARDGGPAIQYLGEIQLEAWKGQVISGGVCLFGIVIECENAMVIVPSDGNTLTLPGEPINWRVFPRSKHYENQLHLVYEDGLEIYSFNQDYLVDQTEKRLGFSYYAPRSKDRLGRRLSFSGAY
jgi:hypothetical protein